MARLIRLKGIKRITKPNGRVYVYRRVRGKLIPLPNLAEDHPDFIRAYLDAEKALPTDNSLAALIGKFLASAEFKSRQPSTQENWRRRLKHIQDKYGKAPADQITTAHIQKALRKLTPGAARTERTVWRGLFAYAVLEFVRPDNPAKEAQIPKYKAQPYEAWTPEDITAYRAHWPLGTYERQAFEVVFWTGARCVDAAHIGWQWVKDGVLEFKQQKTGGMAYVPITAPVASFLEGDRDLFLEAASPDMLFILTGSGKGRSVKALSTLISQSAKAAGIDKSAHGLRKSRASILAENGWTPHQIGAWTGHESLSEIAHYTRDANKKAMIVETQGGNSGKLVKFPK